MATLSFNGSSQYVEFSTLTGGLEGLTVGAHTVGVLQKLSATGTSRTAICAADSARTAAYATCSDGLNDSHNTDVSRGASDDNITFTNTTIWRMKAVTVDTADTPDVTFHKRDHTNDSAWVHTAAFNGTPSPGYAGAGTPGASGFMQIGRWLTGDWFAGDIAVAFAFNYKLSNTQLDDICANDKTSDIWNCTGGPPKFLVECNVAHASLVDLAAGSTLVSPVTSPTLAGGDPERWTFDGAAAPPVPPPDGNYRYGRLRSARF